MDPDSLSSEVSLESIAIYILLKVWVLNEIIWNSFKTFSPYILITFMCIKVHNPEGNVHSICALLT